MNNVMNNGPASVPQLAGPPQSNRLQDQATLIQPIPDNLLVLPQCARAADALRQKNMLPVCIITNVEKKMLVPSH